MLILSFLLFSMLWGRVVGHVEIFPGVHFRERTSLAIYESSIPFTYVIPNNLNDFADLTKFPIPPSPFQDRNLTRLSSIAVELDRHIADIQMRVQPKQNVSLGRRGQRAIEAIGDFFHWGFGTATDGELHAMTDNEEAVNKHLNSLQDIVKGDHLDLIHSIDDMKHFSTNMSQVLKKVKDAVEVLKEDLDNGGRVPVGEAYRNLLFYVIRVQTRIYQGMVLTATNHAHLKCRQNLLPSFYVPRGELERDLRRLSQNISKDGYEIALSITDMDVFYTLPLASCKMSPERVVITVKVPIKRVEDSWSLYEYIPSPMAWKNFTCTLSREPVYVAMSQTRLVTISGQQLDGCQLKPSGLCVVPRQWGGSALSARCAEKMFKRVPMEELRSSCPFFCEESRQGVIITQVAVDSYVITHPTKTLSLNCNNTTLTLPSQLPGAFEIHIPCNCILKDSSSILISRQYPCFNTYKVPFYTHVLPVLWTSLGNLSLHPLEKLARPNYQNYSHVLDLNWNLATPTFLVHSNIPSSAFDHVNLPKAWYDIYEVTSLKYYVMFIWLIVLSLGFVYFFIKIYVIVALVSARGLPPPLPPRG